MVVVMEEMDGNEACECSKVADRGAVSRTGYVSDTVREYEAEEMRVRLY